MSFIVVALLSGARNEKNVNLAEEVFEQMTRLFPGLPNSLIAASVLLSNTFASSGNIERATEMRMKFNPAGAKKKTGLSWTVINGLFYVSEEKIIVDPKKIE
jgi:hypothetical protein